MQRIFLAVLLFFSSTLNAQHHYIPPTDSLVIKKLAEWQNWKFGLLMHWGPYSEWGVVESWSICPEDEDWTQRNPIHGSTYDEYKKNYEALPATFNPVKFDPSKWAAAAKGAGMKYVIFTTKHHDGFCMFDTKQTDYKITGSKTPFSANPKSNVTKEIFSAFREKGFATGAYFSKPDWHNENYWWPYFPPKDRNVNYDPKKYPERWNAFKKFTYDQIEELVSDYGKVDILWLDGGWVRPHSTIDSAISWEKSITYNQDIEMPKIAAMARQHQPGLLIVDRSVGNEFENYTTPEQEVPDKPLPYPWETCMTMATSWSHVPGDKYKSTIQLIHTLVKIVARGGNLLLNIGPDENGEWDDTAYLRLKEIGEWMKINSESIYNTRPFIDNSDNQLFMTISENKEAVYIFCLNNFDQPLSISVNNSQLQNFKKAVILGAKTNVLMKKENDKVTFSTSAKNTSAQLKYAVVIKCIK